ncbi:MAG: hypothetical protein JO122_14520 [Acetobacteraceae bacterium]|nr:hypothetical protein [Acetobacteraceae bacterium]
MTWPWLTIAGLGAFHGLNPAMGWLFAVALGLHRGSRRAVVLALPPLAFGHALSVGLVLAVVAVAGLVIDPGTLRLVAGAILLTWAAYHWRYRHRHRVRIGMTAGFFGLAFWSFLMAGAHGAGLMLLPAVIPLCSGSAAFAGAPFVIALAATALHMLAMLVVTGAVAIAVYEWLGVGMLRQAWVNLDLLWTGALAAVGAVMMLA